jgi:hypothetical protein
MIRFTDDDIEEFQNLTPIDQEFLAEGIYTACLSCWINYFSYHHQYLYREHHYMLRSCAPIPRELAEFRRACRSYTCPHMPLAINHIFELLGK